MGEVQEEVVPNKSFKTSTGVYEIPEDKVTSFLKEFPDALEVNSYKIDADTFDIPVSESSKFLQQFPKAQPLNRPAAPQQSTAPQEYQGTHALGAFNRSLIGGIAAIPKTVSTLAAKVNRMIGNGEPDPTKMAFYQMGKGLEDKALEWGITATDPNKEDSFLETDLPSGLGSVASLALTGGLASAPAKGLAAAAAPSLVGTLAKSLTNPAVMSGGAQMGIAEMEAAKKAGASDDEAFDVFAKDYFVGQT